MCEDLGEVQVFWDTTLCRLVGGSRPFKEKWYLRKVGKH